jgi:hypothetical protein
MKRFFLIIAMVGAGWLIFTKAQESPYEPPAGFKAAMEKFASEAESDAAGPLGQSAKAACKRILGISGPADTGLDVLHSGYSLEIAEKFADCTVNYMYPIDAKKRQ